MTNASFQRNTSKIAGLSGRVLFFLSLAINESLLLF